MNEKERLNGVVERKPKTYKVFIWYMNGKVGEGPLNMMVRAFGVSGVNDNGKSIYFCQIFHFCMLNV